MSQARVLSTAVSIAPPQYLRHCSIFSILMLFSVVCYYRVLLGGGMLSDEDEGEKRMSRLVLFSMCWPVARNVIAWVNLVVWIVSSSLFLFFFLRMYSSLIDEWNLVFFTYQSTNEWWGRTLMNGLWWAYFDCVCVCFCELQRAGHAKNEIWNRFIEILAQKRETQTSFSIANQYIIEWIL